MYDGALYCPMNNDSIPSWDACGLVYRVGGLQ